MNAETGAGANRLRRWAPGIRAGLITGLVVWAVALVAGGIVYGMVFTAFGGQSATGWDALGAAIHGVMVAIPMGAFVGLMTGVRWCRRHTHDWSVVLLRVLVGPLVIGAVAVAAAWLWDSFNTFCGR